jgi:ABC-type lipopolysaccharide export system ATPase subunit
MSIQAQIEKKVQLTRKGKLIFPEDFRGMGTASAIKMALSRLAAKGDIKRLAHGIYYIPQKDPVFGEIFPSVEAIASSIAKKEKVRIKPTGAKALHELGLTTQVPTKQVYLTDGERRQIRIGKIIIQFKPTTPKKMSLSGPLSSLVILGLDDIGTDAIGEDMQKKIKQVLLKEDQALLNKDLAIAPAHIYDYLLTLLRSDNDRMVTVNT